MKNRYLFTMVCVLLAGITSIFGQNNTISIPDVYVGKGKSISLPIYMDNTADVVAVQFTLSVPEGLTLTTASLSLTERSDGHTVTFRALGDGKYMAMIFSSENKPVKGRTGQLLSVTLNASNSLAEGTQLPLALSDVVMGAHDASNLLTGYSAGKVTIAKLPDLEMTEVTVDQSNLSPEGTVNVRWKVANIGDLPTTAGWKEQIYLKNAAGLQKLLGTLYYDAPLETGGVVSRNAELHLPAIIGLDGACHIVVSLTANSNAGEPTWLKDNNTAQTVSDISVQKLLALNPVNATIDEAHTRNVRFQLTRSGDTNSDEVFALTHDVDSRLIFPESVSILKGQSGTYFYAQVMADNVLNNDSIVNFSLAGNDYPTVLSKVRIEDDTFPSLSLTALNEEVTEGESIRFEIATQRASQNDIEVKMTCDAAKRFDIPSTIQIPAGQTSVEVTVEALEDDVPNVEEVATFKVTAAKHNLASVNTVLVDNDVPNLQLEITPNALSEAAGPLAVTATLRRLDNKDKVVTVKLSDNSDGGIYYGRQTIVLEKGIEEATVNLGPVDNALVDGERTYEITAAVWIASCSCNANSGTSGGVVSVPLTVYDNDGPTLNLASGVSVLKEGGEMTVTLKRNTTTSKALTVHLSSDHDEDIEYPKTVIIPAGESEVPFSVKSKGNEVTGDGFTVFLNAAAEGFSTGNIWFNVSDQTLPDVQIASISSMEESCIHGDKITFSIALANKGNSPLPANTLVQLFKSDSQNALADLYTLSAIPAGEATNINISTKADFSIGQHTFFVKANPQKSNAELDYNNNSSSFVTINVGSPFSTSTVVSKSILEKNDEIEISGVASGRNIANNDIDVYVINKGYRHVITTKTDNEGHFSVNYKPFENQNGHFAVGSCFHGDKTETEQCAFDIYAINVTNSARTCDVIKGESYTGNFVIRNDGVLPITNVKASLMSELPNAQVIFSEEPFYIAGGESKTLQYVIKGVVVSPELVWQTLKILFTCDEGATAISDINFYVREPKARLKTNVASINTSVTIGSEREFYLTLTNTGKNETGKITFMTQPWIKPNGIQYVSSLASGESTEVVLIISTDDQMQANNPKHGTIAINCENGDGISIPFNIEPVSSKSGILLVDVCDENTYNTSEGLHVANAKVVVKHPTTGEVITTGTTNKNGIFESELQEGYYALTITADRHIGESVNVYVDPERTRKQIVNLGYSGISIIYDVKPTEIEDEYRLETKVTYETNVPVPIVILDAPEKIDGDNMRAGESTLIYITATNRGLVTAHNNRIILPNNTDEWKFEPLVSLEPVDLPAQQSVVIPVRITRLKDDFVRPIKRVKAKSVADDMQGTFNNCMVHFRDLYNSLCGTDLKENESCERMAMKACALAATSATLMQYLSGLMGGEGRGGDLGFPNGGNPIKLRDATDQSVISEQSFSLCNPCDAKKAEDLLNLLVGKTWLGSLNDILDDAYRLAKDNGGKEEQIKVVKKIWLKALQDSMKEYENAIGEYNIEDPVYEMEVAKSINKKVASKLKETIEVIEITSRDCSEGTEDKANRSWQEDYDKTASSEAQYLRNCYEILKEIYGDETWFDTDIDEKMEFAEYLAENGNLSDKEVLSMRPASISDEQALSLFMRLNGLDEQNIVNFEVLDNLIAENIAMNEAAVAEGYESLSDKFIKAYNICIEKYSEKSSSVCASISLQFSQNMVMTRQAFRGTLTVFNGNETTAMTDVKLSLVVKDESGNVATTHEFQINPETLTGFDGDLNLEEGWTLDAQQTGVTTIMFIPTNYAAPMVERAYSFGGSLSYVDPFTGLTVTRDLSPVVLTVKPLPNLDLTYFMQRDIKGDDPLTLDVIEPSEEAEFSLLINNIGYGEATDVRMFTEQPEIVENEKGLLIDFELMSSQLNGGEKTLALGGTVATDFGTIPAKSTSYAQWWLRSSLLGHFTEYNVEATHLTSYGNPDLSLLNEVSIHELIRSIDIMDGNNTLVGFMTNDIVDAEDTPDMLYLSNGEIESVSLAQNVEIQKSSDTDYLMKVNANLSGWNYGSVSDPTYGVSSLKAVVRQSDGKEMPLRNFWQTDRTLRDGKDPLYENRIHFVDELNASDDETYILTFEPTPELLLEVAAIEGVPEEGSLSVEPVNGIKVVFNKSIDPSTFTVDDISLSVQGVKQDVRSAVLSTDDNKTFSLDFSALNKNVGNGYFLFTVNTSEISDVEGYNGKNGKNAGWIMFRDGLVSLTTSAEPVSAGTIQRVPSITKLLSQNTGQTEDDKAMYGSTVKLTTVPNEGYEFCNWTVNGEVVSDELAFEYVALSDMDIKANYMLKSYAVTLGDVEEGGSISGAASGVYTYGHILNLTVQTNDDYVFDGWIVNGENLGNNNDLSLLVNEAKEIHAQFKRIIFKQDITLTKGWNWVSSWISEPVQMSGLLSGVSHIVSQFDEIINDPVYGMIGGIEVLQPGLAYKVDASYASIKSFKGHIHDINDKPVELHKGWNWISYPYYEERNINEVISNPSEGEYLTSQFGFSEFADGYWEGTLTNLTPGFGYIYKSCTDKTLLFDFSEKASRTMMKRATATRNDVGQQNVDVYKYPSTMNMIVQLSDGYSMLDNADYRIYAFAGNECRGESQYVGKSHYLTVYGDEATTITFVFEDVNLGNTYMAKESLTFCQEVIGNRKSPYIITITAPTSVQNIGDLSHRMTIYSVEGILISSDANADTLKQLKHGVYIVDGQKFLVK